MSITLDTVVPWGRSMEEYYDMFALSEQELGSRILGCGDGPASFNCEMTELGHSVISIDPIYQYSAVEIESRVRETYQLVVDPLFDNLRNYVWERFSNPDVLGQHRLKTMNRFLEDYEVGRAVGRYKAQSVPNLDFANNAFNITLCSHFLFLYTAQLSYAFHKEAILELCRVSSEVRIFPLLDLGCQESPYVTQLQTELTALGHEVAIEKVPYEFQRGGNRMMRIVTY